MKRKAPFEGLFSWVQQMGLGSLEAAFFHFNH
jgi:hypothetical protein